MAAVSNFEKTGAGEGIRTLDPNLGKIQAYEFIDLNQIFIKHLKNRTRSEHSDIDHRSLALSTLALRGLRWLEARSVLCPKANAGPQNWSRSFASVNGPV